MTVSEILGDEALRRHEFPVAGERIYLSHAGVTPLPRRVTEAMGHYLKASGTCDQEQALPAGFFRDLRTLAAQLIQAQPDEIALVGPTSLALSLIAGGLNLGRTDNILVYHEDYPSNVYPWMALAQKKVEVRFLNIRELGRIRLRDVAGQADENTRLVALASCHFISGWRVDLEGIGQWLRERRILFCVDAIQTVGVFPTPAGQVDFMAADAHKWMLGPAAAGLLYVRKACQDRLQPLVHGWHNVLCPGFVAQDRLEFKPDARRYEAGTANLTGLVGWKAALELLLELGVENIAAELLRKRSWVIPALQAKGYTVLEAGAPTPHAGGIITFHREGSDMGQIHAKLAENKVDTSLRTDRRRRRYVRLSPHFYNTDEELRRVLELL